MPLATFDCPKKVVWQKSRGGEGCNNPPFGGRGLIGTLNPRTSFSVTHSPKVVYFLQNIKINILFSLTLDKISTNHFVWRFFDIIMLAFTRNLESVLEMPRNSHPPPIYFIQFGNSRLKICSIVQHSHFDAYISGTILMGW